MKRRTKCIMPWQRSRISRYMSTIQPPVDMTHPWTTVSSSHLTTYPQALLLLFLDFTYFLKILSRQWGPLYFLEDIGA